MKTLFTSVLIALSAFTSQLTAQVIINEFSASNLESFTDGFQKTEDWIELYNNSDSAVDISGWFLSDKVDNPEKWQIPAGAVIEARAHLLFICSGRDGFLRGHYHTNFKLSQTKDNEVIQLADASGNVLESYPLGLALVEHSHARMTDGSPEWRVSASPSFGTANDSVSTFSRYTETPSMSLEAGYYTGSQVVTLINNEPNSVLRYTLDGTNPTILSDEYTVPLNINETTVVKAQAFSTDTEVRPGKMDFKTFFIDEDFSLAVFSVAADDVIDLANGEGDLIPIGSIEYFNVDKELEATSFGSLNRHGQDSWVLDHRSLDWVSRDEMGYSRAVQAPLFGFSDRDSYQKFMFRNSGDDNYPALQNGALEDVHRGSTHVRDEYVQTLAQNGGMKLDNRAVERVVVFLNGEYWGVYGMRDRPVDHDYTDEYYNQGKYDIQYLTTWGTTEIEYGGKQALNDWQRIRDFVLENDMSLEENYTIVEDSINMLSLIDYFLVNLNVVAKDWLNYNTGWWRGLDPDGDHKKWGYILWDLDAVFGYYINYTEIPDETPNAMPCDVEDVAVYMDEFFSFFGGGGQFQLNPIDEPELCNTILNGDSPYPVTDSIFLLTIAFDNSCCDDEWDFECQSVYDFIESFGTEFFEPVVIEECPVIVNGDVPYEPTDSFFIQTIEVAEFCCEEWEAECQEVYDFLSFGGVYGVDVGQHEKIFLKLLEENPTFKQLYYGRYADMMNTVFSCENMLTTLDSMIAVIEPEMPKQIDRWGGSLNQWERNVSDLREFITERCAKLDDGAVDCYDELTGPYEITLQTKPDGIGEIDFNTLDIESFPWTGEYFGGMENNIKAKVFGDFEDDWEFRRWETTSGNAIAPDLLSRRATISLMTSDTLTAIFGRKDGTSVYDIKDNELDLAVYPNPAHATLTIDYTLQEAMKVKLGIYTVLGELVYNPEVDAQKKPSGNHKQVISLEDQDILPGLYNVIVEADGERYVRKVTVVR